MIDNIKKQSIFSHELISKKLSKKNPVIIVGLPRSGSSYLSDVVSQIGSIYIFDDLYLHRKAVSIGVKDEMSREQFEKLLFFLGWQIRARLKFGKFSVPNMSMEDVEEMNQALRLSYKTEIPHWHELQEEWLLRLALLHGSENWGYKQPNAFFDIDMLFDLYPNVRFIFLFRNPEDVLSSYKFMVSGHNDGNKNRYHPIAYALYWRSSVKHFLHLADKSKNRVMDVQFDDLIRDPLLVAAEISQFLGLKAPKKIELRKANTSFTGRKRETINGLEQRVVRKIAGKYMDRFGYSRETKNIKIGDYFDFLGTSITFLLYHLKNTISKKGKDVSLVRAIKKIISLS